MAMLYYINKNKALIFIISLLVIFSCKTKLDKDKSHSLDSAKNALSNTSKISDTSSVLKSGSIGDTTLVRKFYVIVLNEGHNYDSLLSICKMASKDLKVPINTLERIYSPEKGIHLPDSCNDDINCGEYLPRDYSDEDKFLSIEMKYVFHDYHIEKLGRENRTMVIVALISKNKEKADAFFDIIKPKFSTAKIIQTKLFTGCSR